MFDYQQLFTIALGLTAPWKISNVEFIAEDKRLDIHLDFEPGTKFVCPSCSSQDATAYDSTIKIWRYLNFFQHATYLHVRVPIEFSMNMAAASSR